MGNERDFMKSLGIFLGGLGIFLAGLAFMLWVLHVPEWGKKLSRYTSGPDMLIDDKPQPLIVRPSAPKQAPVKGIKLTDEEKRRLRKQITESRSGIEKMSVDREGLVEKILAHPKIQKQLKMIEEGASLEDIAIEEALESLDSAQAEEIRQQIKSTK